MGHQLHFNASSTRAAEARLQQRPLLYTAEFYTRVVVKILSLCASQAGRSLSQPRELDQKREIEKGDHNSWGPRPPNDSPTGGAGDFWSVLRFPRQLHPGHTRLAWLAWLRERRGRHSRGRPATDIPTGAPPHSLKMKPPTLFPSSCVIL